MRRLPSPPPRGRGGAPQVWRSWSGLSTGTPARVLAPGSTGEVVALVSEAADRGIRLKMAGSGHSFTDIALTDGLLLLPDRLRGVCSVDREAMTVTVRAGTPLNELNTALHQAGLALHNLGDIDRQTVAGAIATGTHGTGGRVASLSGQVCALELVTGDGEVRWVSAAADPDLFHAALVGLGAVGVMTSVTFRVEPAFVLGASETTLPWNRALSTFEELVAGNDHVDLYWFPHTDRVLVKRNNRTTAAPRPLPGVRRWVEEELLANTVFGWLNALGNARPRLVPHLNRLATRAQGVRRYRDASHRVFTSPRRVPFREMEYAVPREVGVEALREARALIERSGWRVGFPVEVRTAPAEPAWLSPAHARSSVYLAFHVNAATDHRTYFGEVERLLCAYGGRPHWGKLHTRAAADLAPAYPRWDDFASVRERADPLRLFANSYLDRVLGS